VGNVLGTSVSLTGQKLINGITTANTYTPIVNAPSQVISLSSQTMPGLNLSTPRSVGTTLPTAVAGTASYVDQSVGVQTDPLGPQQLLEALPANLQPSTTLFYYNPQEEDLMLQQAALQQTGEASFISGLSDSSTNGTVTEQEKQDLYGNAVAYAEQNNIQLGTALTQTQINALTQPMLWYVQQTVPDPDCTATGTDTCPTITALMPQVYLPANYNALSAGGNIEASNSLTLNFGSAATGGSVTNTGSITSGGTLTVNTGTLTNEANQVNVGQIWNSVKGGYTDTTGTEVQPGGFMSAADMQLNVQTLQQIGGALQQLNADGTVDQAGTQQLVAQLQQQLGGSFTQQTLSNNLNTSFVAEGGFGLTQLGAMIAAVVASIVTYGAASAAIGSVLGSVSSTFLAAVPGVTAGLGNIALSAGIAGIASSVTSQVIDTGGVNWGSAFEAGAVAAVTAGLTNGISYNSSTGLGFSTGPLTLGGPTSSLSMLAGVQTVGGSLVPQAGAAAASNLPEEVLAVGADATISAGVQTAIEGGSFLDNLKTDAVSDVAADAAYAIGNLNDQQFFGTGLQGDVGYDLAHAALGCAAGAADGTGCAGGAIGGAASAAFSPDLIKAMDPSAAPLTTGQQAALAGFATLLGGGLAGLAGQNVTGGATAAQNEALNNAGNNNDVAGSAQNGGLLTSFGNWLVNTYGDPVGSVENWINQFTGQVQSGAQATASQSSSALVAQSVANGANAVLGAGGGLPPAAGSDAVLVNSGQAAPLANGNSPSNAILSSGSSGGSGSGSDESSVAPSTPTGQGGSPMDVSPGTNSPATIGGISYSGHALDEMQSDGIVPSAVQNAIETGTAVSGKNPGTVAYYDSVNNITVVTSSSSGKVITVSFGKIRQ
jgi:filamentous hemagglutinin